MMKTDLAGSRCALVMAILHFLDEFTIDVPEWLWAQGHCWLPEF